MKVEDSLKERTAKGLLWGMVNNGTTQLLNAVFGILFLRWLEPKDYGKIAMLMVFANIASTLQESGFTAALCNLRNPTHRDYNAVFWFNIGVSALLYIILFLAAPLIVWFYRDPDLLWLSRYLFLGFFISSWGTVQRAYLFIHLMNKQTAIIGIVALLVSGTVGVAMVACGYAYWGQATQNVLFILVVALMNWYYSPWRPTLHIDLRPAWRMFGFSSKLLVQNLFNNLNAHAFGVLLGRFYGDHQAGVYSNARSWDDKGINTINGMVSGVAQPVLSRVRDDQGRYRNVFRKMLRFVSFVSFPAMLGLGLVAREFLLIVGFYPASFIKADRLPAATSVVFVFETILYDFKLQLPDGADDLAAVELIDKQLSHSLVHELVDTFLELFRAHRVVVFNVFEHFR